MAEINDLQRFLTAQEKDYATALRELTAGKKRNHYMWYIFPQLRALGQSETAYFYGIADMAEAKAYLENAVLKERLISCCQAMLLHTDKSALKILGDIDKIKLKSSMTLFALANGEENSVFYQVLQQFYHGKLDARTVEILAL